MGWTFRFIGYNPKNKKEIVENEINKEKFEIVKSAMVGYTYYAAIKDKRSKEVFGLVVLTRYEGREFGTKFIEETSGPSEDKCPMSIIKLLSPTDNKWANEWRERCKKNADSKGWQKKLDYGDKVKWNDMILIKHPPAYQFKTWFWYVEGGGYVPKTRVKFEDVEVL